MDGLSGPKELLARRRNQMRGGVERSSSGSQPVWGPRSARPLMLHKWRPRPRIALSPRGRSGGDSLVPLLPVWISRLDVQGLVLVPHGCHGDLEGARQATQGAWELCA